MAKAMGVQMHRTTPYHPQSNGMIERWHRRLKDALRARLEGRDGWVEHLPWIMLGLRAAPCLDTLVSPCEMVMGAPVALPSVMMPEDSGRPPSQLATAIRKVLPGEPLPLAHHNVDRSWVPPALRTASHVFVKDTSATTLQPRYNGPFKVLARGQTSFLVQRGAGRDAINISNLKPAVMSIFDADPSRPGPSGVRQAQSRQPQEDDDSDSSSGGAV